MGARLTNGRKKKKRLAHRNSRLKEQQQLREGSSTEAGQRKR